MGIRLSREEAWEFLGAGHTGILTTLRADGWPVSLPVWYAVSDGAIYVRTPAKTRKVGRVRRDGRCSFLVESGKAWKELKAVVVTGRAALVEDADEAQRAGDAISAKYAAFREAQAALPRATREHYAGTAILRIDPVGDFLTWDNARIRLRSG